MGRHFVAKAGIVLAEEVEELCDSLRGLLYELVLVDAPRVDVGLALRFQATRVELDRSNGNVQMNACQKRRALKECSAIKISKEQRNRLLQKWSSSMNELNEPNFLSFFLSFLLSFSRSD